MLCELCGNDVPFLKPILIEGSLLKVCPTCGKFGSASPPSVKPNTTSKARVQSGSTPDLGYTTKTPTKKEVIQNRLEKRERRMSGKDIYELRGEKELALDFHIRIQKARNQLNLSQDELGQKINERKSVISKIENKSMKPDDKLVRKLEKALGIKLMETFED